MARKNWFLILTIFVIFTQQIQAACVCNEKGTDAACSCSGVIRPRPKHTKRPEIKLPAVGDTCWCSKTMIQPASMPKPCPKYEKPSTTCGCHGVPLPPSYIMPQVNYIAKDNSPPADPISISLAVQAGKAIQVPEAKLAYGFVRQPVNNLPKVYISSIKEENLYALANDVITLKKPMATRPIQMEEDYPEPDEEEPETEDYEPPRLTYKQLGYETEVFQNPTFVPMPSLAAVAESASYLMDDGKKYDGSECGFKPGRIAKIKHRRKFGPLNCLVKNY